MDPATIAKIIKGLKTGLAVKSGLGAAKGGVAKGGNPMALGGVYGAVRAGLSPEAKPSEQYTAPQAEGRVGLSSPEASTAPDYSKFLDFGYSDFY